MIEPMKVAGGLVGVPAWNDELNRAWKAFLDPTREKEQTMGTEKVYYSERHPATMGLLKFFEYAHLPDHLKLISAPCAELAEEMVLLLPDGPELTTGLRKLLEAKDCFVRAAL